MRRLLLVDNDPTDCGRLARVLTGLGYGLDVTFSADDARMLNEQQAYSWSVIGTPLDGKDGLALFQQLRERQTRMRGLLVLNELDSRSRGAAHDAGLDVISRPIDVNVLIPWLSQNDRLASGAIETAKSVDAHPKVDEAYVRAIPETIIREQMSEAELIRIIRGVDYPFAGKERLESFDHDTLCRVVLLIRRWCLSRR
jgi:DNA-binding response OmpR family regulator